MATQQAYIAAGGLAGLILIVGLIALLVARRGKKKTQQWVEFAQASGLTSSGSYPLMRMSGALDGVSVGIEHHRETTYHAGYSSSTSGGVQQTVKAWCEAWAQIPNGTGDLQLAEEGIISKLAKLVGAQDIQTGDTSFDKKFMVKSAMPDVARARLTPAVRAALIALEGKLRGEITIADSAVKWKHRGSVGPERALDVIKQLAEAANSFKN